MEKIFEIAKELGSLIAEHPFGVKYHDCCAKLDADAKAKELIKNYETAAMTISQKEQKGEPIEPEEKRSVMELQSQLTGNDTVKNWLKAQVDYMDLMRKVNEQVMLQVTPAAKKS